MQASIQVHKDYHGIKFEFGLAGLTFKPDGIGTSGSSTVDQDISQSSYVGDKFSFLVNGNNLNVSGSGDTYFYSITATSGSTIYYSVGQTVNGLADTGNGTGSIVSTGTNVGAWTVDRPNGAIGFENAEGETGYIRVSWVAATQTLTILSGAFEDAGGSIFVTAVPEPSTSALLGLGAIGVAYYRRLSGNNS